MDGASARKTLAEIENCRTRIQMHGQKTPNQICSTVDKLTDTMFWTLLLRSPAKLVSKDEMMFKQVPQGSRWGARRGDFASMTTKRPRIGAEDEPAIKSILTRGLNDNELHGYDEWKPIVQDINDSSSDNGEPLARTLTAAS